MSWPVRVVIVAVLGLVLGMVTVLGLTAPALQPLDRPTPAPLPAIDPRPLPQPSRHILLVWTPRELPAGLSRAVGALPATRTVSVVMGDRVDFAGTRSASGDPGDLVPDGWAIPLDALAIDVASYSRLLPASGAVALQRLAPGTAIVGETSARLRNVAPGDLLRLRSGVDLKVAGVVDDTFVGAAELVVHNDDAARVGIDTRRFLLVSYDGPRTAMERRIRRLVPDGVTARIRGPGETPYLRHGDAVLPQALVKATFGEFAYRSPGNGVAFEQDPAWVREHIVNARVPILGDVRCHRSLIAPLRGALGELADAGLAHLVDPAQFAGCWNPRLVSASGGVSRHAWGIAVDLNAAQNPTGKTSGIDRRLVEVMERFGFTWGGVWLVPDAMHFEYARPQ